MYPILTNIRYNLTNKIKPNLALYGTNKICENKTSLYDYHISKNGKMVNFAGYLLPVQYADSSISASHLHTRKYASVFDVSHMLQTHIRGKDAIACFETICTADIKNLKDNTGTLTVFLNTNGGILDDLIVSKISSDHLFIVSNAAMKDQDMEIMNIAINDFQKKSKDVAIEFMTLDQQALLAIQGPSAVSSLQKLTSTNLDKLYFMQTIESEIFGIKSCRITRCGYTGEDGVEISIPANKAQSIVDALLSLKECNVRLAGLGARDSLRLEAGLCLYGNDIDSQTTPIEAALNWLVGKRRRTEANFPGASIINEQLRNGVQRKRIGFQMENGPPARYGVEIFHENQKIGSVTSGCPSPSLGLNIGMGYIKENFKKVGTKIQLKVRGKFYDAEIVKMPFISSKYYTK